LGEDKGARDALVWRHIPSYCRTVSTTAADLLLNINMSVYAVVLSLVTFLSTLSGGLLVVRFKAKLAMVGAFAAGVLIAVPLFDLLPESLKLSSEVNVPLESIMYAAALGFVVLLFLERYVSVHRVCEEDHCRNVRHPKGGLFGAAELSIHSFMDGLAIGVGFHLNFHVGVVVAVAVVSHDFSDGINTVTIMLKSGNSLRSTFLMLLADATTPVLGVVSTFFISIPERFLVLILPFFAGGFLYLGASDLLPEAHEKNPPLLSFLFNVSGFIVILIITRFLNV
jgi:zinc transporter ZupT